MKAAPRDIAGVLRKLDPGIHAVLVYGPNEGLVRERGDMLARQVVPDLRDAFNVAILTAADIAADPARLADEAAAMSLMGGRRVVRIDNAADAIAAPLAGVLEDFKGDSLIVICAAELPPRSALRQLVEGARNALAIPCYDDDSRSLNDLIQRGLGEQGLKIDADAVAYMVENVGADRMVARGEIEKLALYMASEDDRVIRLRDVEAIIGNSAATAVDEVAAATLGGDFGRLDHAMTQATVQGQAAVSVLRAVARRIIRLYDAAAHVADGMRAEEAVKKLRPPVFFKDIDPFVAQLRRWTPERLAAALKLVTAAEADVKSGIFPADVVCARACLRIASAARQGQG